MGAIYGIMGAADPSELAAMGQRLQHRGTSHREWSPSADIHLGLRFNGGGGDQNEVALFDGALDNAAELTALLGEKPRPHESPADVELAWRIFRRFGAAGLGHLSGQFALAFWEPESRRMVMACDRWGSRSIYYARTGGRIVFASEYKALLTIDDLPARCNPDAILYAVRTHNADPRKCFLAGVEVVPRGSCLVLPQDPAASTRFWDISIEVAQRSEQEHADAVRNCLFDALRRQVEPHASIGLGLSGGLDSALVLAGIRHVAPAKTVHTFTVGHGDEDREIIGARETAAHFKTSHHEIIVGAEHLPAVLPEAVWHMEDPVGGEEMIYAYIAAKEASRFVDNVFTGEKSDALFGGMPRHLLVSLAARLRPLAGVLEEFFTYTQTRRMPSSLPGRLLVNYYFRNDRPTEISVIGAREFPRPRPLPLDAAQPLSAKLRQDMLDGSSTLGATVQLHAALGLSWNSPFMDAGFTRTAFQIPDSLKIRGLRQKYILRRACEGLTPDSILKRKKSLQRLRNDGHLTDVLESLAADLLSHDAVASRGIFEPAEVARLRARPAQGYYSREQVFSLWSLLITETWARLYLDNRGRPPPRH